MVITRYRYQMWALIWFGLWHRNRRSPHRVPTTNSLEIKQVIDLILPTMENKMALSYVLHLPSRHVIDPAFIVICRSNLSCNVCWYPTMLCWLSFLPSSIFPPVFLVIFPVSQSLFLSVWSYDGCPNDPMLHQYCRTLLLQTHLLAVPNSRVLRCMLACRPPARLPTLQDPSLWAHKVPIHWWGGV